METIYVEPVGHRLRFGRSNWPCALGQGGVRGPADKCEGDGATPLGQYQLEQVLYRPDRVATPEGALPHRPLSPQDGWCDAPNDQAYNQKVQLPYPVSAERLWRNDSLYDLIVVLSHNRKPAIPGRGSAIFLHVAKRGLAGGLCPTLGCIALAKPDLLNLLAQIPASTAIHIGGPA